MLLAPKATLVLYRILHEGNTHINQDFDYPEITSLLPESACLFVKKSQHQRYMYDITSWSMQHWLSAAGTQLEVSLDLEDFPFPFFIFVTFDIYHENDKYN